MTASESISPVSSLQCTFIGKFICSPALLRANFVMLLIGQEVACTRRLYYHLLHMQLDV